jgi:hypothetical protein
MRWIRPYIKLALMIIVGFFLYQQFMHYKGQYTKSLSVLMSEYDQGESEDAFLIIQKLTIEDIGLLETYSFSENAETRVLVAEGLGSIASPKGINTLRQLLQDKNKEVRTFAANSLGKIPSKKSVAHLVTRLDYEKDSAVRGTIGGSLKDLTQQRFTVLRDDWQRWWKGELGPVKLDLPD